MKSLLLILVTTFLLSTAVSKADSNADYYLPPYVFHGNIHGVPYGYGYFHFPHWPNYFTPVNPYYFSYWPYYNYAPYYATFGAISYSTSTNQVGVAWGQPTLYSSKNASLSFCGAKDCRPVVWVQGGCAAISVSKVTKSIGWAYAIDRYSAQNQAYHSCKKISVGERCENTAWVCAY